MEFHDEYEVPEEPVPPPEGAANETAMEPRITQVSTSETASASSGSPDSPSEPTAPGSDEDDPGFFSDPILHAEQGLHTLELVQEQSHATEEQLAQSREGESSTADSGLQTITGTQEALWAPRHGSVADGAAGSPFDAGVIMALAGALILKKCGEGQDANVESEEQK